MDDATFAQMLAVAAPKAKSDKSAKSDKDDEDNKPRDKSATADSASTSTVQTAQPAAQAKPAKDTKASDASDDQGATDAATTPNQALADASLMMVAAPQPPVAANDAPADGSDALAATAAASAVAPQFAAAADDAQGDDAQPAGGVPVSKQSQQAAQQPAPQQPAPDAQAAIAPQPKPAAKPSKPVEAGADTAKTARKTVTADAGDGIKSAANTSSNESRADAAPVSKDAPQPQANAPQPAAPGTNLTIAGLAAPQGQTQTGAPQTPAPVHIEVTAQPQPNLPALAVQIAAKSQSGARQFDIRLDPPELGRVEVRLSIDATGKASAHLSADQPQTLDLLQKDAPTLTRALRDAGLDVSQDGLNFSLRQQTQDSAGNRGFSGGNTRGRTMLGATASIDIPTNATSAYRAPLDGRLDIRV